MRLFDYGLIPVTPIGRRLRSFDGRTDPRAFDREEIGTI